MSPPKDRRTKNETSTIRRQKRVSDGIFNS